MVRRHKRDREGAGETASDKPSKKKGKEPERPPDDSDADGSDDDGSSSDRGSINVGTEDREEMQVDFAFYDPEESDYHGMRTLLASGASIMPPGATWDVSGLAGVVSEQAAVGSVVKIAAEGGDEPADGEVLGFLTAISLHAHKSACFAKEFGASALSRCAAAADKQALEKMLGGSATGLVVSERLLNLPAALIPSLVDSLLQDIEWARENADEASDRKNFGLDTLLLVANVELGDDETAAAEGGAASSSAAPSAAPGKKKKKKKGKGKGAAGAGGSSELDLHSLDFCRAEEGVLAHVARFCTLLNGTGKTRQLLMALELGAIREALPALHAAMGED